MKEEKFVRTGIIFALLFAFLSLPVIVSAEEYGSKSEKDSGTNIDVGAMNIHLDGFFREYVSINLQDQPETKVNDAWNISMARTSLEGRATTTVNEIRLRAVGRIDAEMETDYLRRLESIGAAGGDLMSKYNRSDLREATAEFDVGGRTVVTLGKQQIVWGETDFFQAMDMVQGYDFTWRSFLESENEETRKALVSASVKIQVPEANGNLQLFIRPGFDRNKDIGTSIDLFGGRWASSPNKGFNVLPLVPFNYHHPDGDAERPTWGARWSGTAGGFGYSLAYLTVLGPNPAVNPIDNPYHSAPTGPLGEFFYPKVNVYGATANYDSRLLNAVFAAEVAYTPGQYYNFGFGAFTGLPGWGGVIRKDTVRSMLRMDKIIDTTFFTSRPSDLSVQVFDTWITGFEEKDDIKDNPTYGAPKKEHSTLATAALFMHYWNDRVSPTLAAGYDISYQDWFVIPSIEYAPGDKWRLKVEADIFLPKNSKSPGQIENSTHLIGTLNKNNQLYFRLTRLF